MTYGETLECCNGCIITDSLTAGKRPRAGHCFTTDGTPVSRAQRSKQTTRGKKKKSARRNVMLRPCAGCSRSRKTHKHTHKFTHTAKQATAGNAANGPVISFAGGTSMEILASLPVRRNNDSAVSWCRSACPADADAYSNNLYAASSSWKRAGSSEAAAFTLTWAVPAVCGLVQVTRSGQSRKPLRLRTFRVTWCFLLVFVRKLT